MYDGLYHILPTPERAGYARPGPGEIIRHVDPHGHPTDNWRLCCPFCGKKVHVFAAQIGNPDAPTFDRPMKCGCTARCGEWFRIAAGRVTTSEPEAKIGEDIMERAMAIPGVQGKPRGPTSGATEEKPTP